MAGAMLDFFPPSSQSQSNDAFDDFDTGKNESVEEGMKTCEVTINQGFPRQPASPYLQESIEYRSLPYRIFGRFMKNVFAGYVFCAVEAIPSILVS